MFDKLISSKISRVRTKEIFCNNFPNKCTSSFDGIFFYYDDDHLTKDGAKLVVDEVLATLIVRFFDVFLADRNRLIINKKKMQ